MATKKMKKDSSPKKEYVNFMEGRIVQGNSERVLETNGKEEWFLPHHVVQHSYKEEAAYSAGR